MGMLTHPPGSTPSSKPASLAVLALLHHGRFPLAKSKPQPTKLEAVDDSLDPLGPLGGGDVPVAVPLAPVDQAPTPPRKELAARVNRQSSGTSPAMGSAEYEDTTLPVGRAKGPPPVQPQAGAPSMRQTPSSMSVEQAAKRVSTFRWVIRTRWEI